MNFFSIGVALSLIGLSQLDLWADEASSSSSDFTPPPVTQLDSKIEARVDGLLKQLTDEEKIGLLSAASGMGTLGVPRLGIPALKCSDASGGLRSWGHSTAYPALALLAATWDPQIAHEVGVALGHDARARGVNVLLGPGMNIYREAQNSRNFEYMGEDPFLASFQAVEYIRGLQSQGVAACIKHFAVNEQETQRRSVDEIVSKRAMEEIYFPPFRAAIEEGNAWSVMAAYNKVNGDWCTASHYLLTDVLRREWNFHGLLMSDWGAVHETKGDLNAGMDLEMGGHPRNKYYNKETIPPLLASGEVTHDTLNEHVRRLLRLMVAMGFMDRNQTDSSIPLDDPASAATALKEAGEGIVLLKNQDGLLPLHRTAIHHLVVAGPNADEPVVCGGGSGEGNPFTTVSVLQAIQTAAGSGIQVESVSSDAARDAAKAVWQTDDSGGKVIQGLMADYFANNTLSGTPAGHRVDPQVDFAWGMDAPINGITGASAFSVRWQGTFTVPETGQYTLGVDNDDRVVVYLDDKQIMESSYSSGMGHADAVVSLEQNRSYKVRVEYLSAGGYADVHFGWAKTGYSVAQAKQITGADAVVFAGGLNKKSEHEGSDRAWEMPPEQEAELQQLLTLNPHVIVVINAGGNLGLGANLDKIPALLWAWYPGQNGNTALANIIFGDLNPSGHLPDTFEKRFEDSPAFGNFPGDPAKGGSVHLDEGIYVGYRWFDQKKIEPAFPFGFGLSYTSFSIKNAKVNPLGATGDDRFDISVEATNTGALKGAEVVQLYVRPPSGSTDRPVQELKAFARVDLQPGETKSVNLSLDRRSFATYDEATSTWKVLAGEYQLAIGSSSRDIALTIPVSVSAKDL